MFMFEMTNYSFYFFIGIMVALSIIIFICLIRAVLGPRFTDRIVAANMIGTKTITFVAFLAVFLDEGFLIDICLIYAMLSFLAVVVLSKIVVVRERMHNAERITELKKHNLVVEDRSLEEE